MQTAKTEYDIQAEEFAEKYNLTMQTTYLGHYPKLSEHATSQWNVILTRPNKQPFIFQFSQSIHDSWQHCDYVKTNRFKRLKGIPLNIPRTYWPKGPKAYKTKQYYIEPVKTPPSLYSVLACLTKYDPDTFDNFYSDFGYDTDSRKAFELYTAVQKEWSEVRRLFDDCLEELAEIN